MNKDINQKEIIERISKIRTESNLSARALSQMINKSDAYINHLEAGIHVEPSLSTLLDICEACNTPLEKFFYYDMDQYEIDKKLLNFFKTLSQKQKEAILNLYR